MVTFVYPHAVRNKLHKLCEYLSALGIESKLAPVGFEIGSFEWKAQVTETIKNSDAVIAIYSHDYNQVEDKWFNWRIACARCFGIPIIPVVDTPVTVIPDNVLSDPERCLEWIRERAQSLPHHPDLKRCQFIGPTDVLYKIDYLRIYSSIKELMPLNQIIQVCTCFISYSRTDSRFVANLVGQLTRHRVKTWRDVDNIAAGSHWDTAIQNALSNCSHLLLVVTPRAIASKTIIDEINYALDKDKPIIPLVLEHCELPFRIRRSQWVDFTSPDKFKPSMEILLKGLGLGNQYQ